MFLKADAGPIKRIFQFVYGNAETKHTDKLLLVKA